MSFVVYPLHFFRRAFLHCCVQSEYGKPFLSRSVCNDAGKPLVCAPRIRFFSRFREAHSFSLGVLVNALALK